MHADYSSQIQNPVFRSPLAALTLAVIALTGGCALLTLITGNHLSRLYAASVDAIHMRKSIETDSMADLQSKHDAAVADLDKVRQALEAEKTVTVKLRRQIAAATKELEQARVQLNAATKQIEQYKTTLNESTPSPAPAIAPPVSRTKPATPAGRPALEVTPSGKTQTGLNPEHAGPVDASTSSPAAPAGPGPASTGSGD